MKSILPFVYIVSFAILILGIGHFAIYKSIITVFDITNRQIVNLTRIILTFGLISFILANFIIQLSYTRFGALFYQVSAYWLGTVYFLFLASIIILIVYSIFHLFSLPIIYAKTIGILVIVIGLGISFYGILHSYNILTTKYTVSIDNLPQEWDGKNVVLFADSHFGNVRNIDFGKKLINKINDQNPKMVLIAGDYYDGPPANNREIASLLSNIKAENGIIFAPGNHEDYGNSVIYKELLANAGVEVLDNKVINIKGLQIAGINYSSGSDENIFIQTLKTFITKDDLPKILIKHAPTNLSVADEAQYDLVVSGHVHNGQIWPGPWITKKIYKEFSYGLNYLNEMAIITTSGVGTWGPPQRVGTDSEIVVIELKKK